MATAEILAARRMNAARAMEKRARGLARILDLEFKPAPNVRYPDEQHRQADIDERTLSILTAVLKNLEPTAPELE